MVGEGAGLQRSGGVGSQGQREDQSGGDWAAEFTEHR